MKVFRKKNSRLFTKQFHTHTHTNRMRCLCCTLSATSDPDVTSVPVNDVTPTYRDVCWMYIADRMLSNLCALKLYVVYVSSPAAAVSMTVASLRCCTRPRSAVTLQTRFPSACLHHKTCEPFSMVNLLVWNCKVTLHQLD
jgi:hypothetical protein